jgi:hypothetical protein
LDFSAVSSIRFRKGLGLWGVKACDFAGRLGSRFSAFAKYDSLLGSKPGNV